MSNGILVDPLRDAGERRQPVVAGVAADRAAVVADVVGQRGDQDDRAVLVVVVEEVVRAHPLDEQGLGRVGSDVLGQLLDRVDRNPGDLRDLLRGAAVVEVLLDGVEDRAHLDVGAVDEGDAERALECRVDVAREVVAGVVVGDHRGPAVLVSHTTWSPHASRRSRRARTAMAARPPAAASRPVPRSGRWSGWRSRSRGSRRWRGAASWCRCAPAVAGRSGSSRSARRRARRGRSRGPGRARGRRRCRHGW